MPGDHDRLDTPIGGEEALQSWRNHLTGFEVRVWPMFQSHGISKDTALILWHLNLVRSDVVEGLDELRELLEDA